MRKAVLIIEDNESHLNALKQLVCMADSEAAVIAVNNSADAYKMAHEYTIDVFLVDIILDCEALGDTSGVRFVENIRTLKKYEFTPVIFITALEDPELYAYRELHCFGYIEKPFSETEVMELVKRALNYSSVKNTNKTLFFRKHGILFPVKCREIVYMETIRRHMEIHMKNGTVITIPYRTCKQILEEADSEYLFQCSRNAIVNREYISNVDITNRYINLCDDTITVEIGVTYRNKVLMELKC